MFANVRRTDNIEDRFEASCLLQLATVMRTEQETREVAFSTMIPPWNFMLVNVSARNSSRDNDVISAKRATSIWITTILRAVRVRIIFVSMDDRTDDGRLFT